MPLPPPVPANCQGCGVEFRSRNAVFRHLKDTKGACLTGADLEDFQRYVMMQDRKKVLVLYGYLLLPEDCSGDGVDDKNDIQNGNDAAVKLLEVLEEQIAGCLPNASTSTDSKAGKSAAPPPKINRSYGNNGRNVDMLQQDDRSGAISEVLSTRLPPILSGSLEEWLGSINALLAKKGYGNRLRALGRLDDNIPSKFNAELDVTHRRIEYLLPADFLSPGQTLPLEAFYASLPSFADGNYNLQIQRNPTDEGAQQMVVAPASIEQNIKGDTDKTDDPMELSVPLTSQLDVINLERKQPNPETLNFLHALKKIMQRLTTTNLLGGALNDGDGAGNNGNADNDNASVKDTAVQNKQQKRKRRGFKSNNNKKHRRKENVQSEHANKDDNAAATQLNSTPFPTEKATSGSKNSGNKGCQIASTGVSNTNSNRRKKDSCENAADKKKSTKSKVLRRRRFHNFTPKSMAHDFFAYRRMDRMYHRATLRFPDSLYGRIEQQQKPFSSKVTLNRHRPFVAISVSGDLFLHGQVCRVMGLLIALARRVVDEDFVECVFDENYPHLVPVPAAPNFAMYAGEAFYSQWEGKMSKILTPRKQGIYEGGWGNPETLQRIHDWQTFTREEIARVWLLKGVNVEDGRLLAEKEWTEQVLVPWAVNAQSQLEDYRLWKENATGTALANNNPEDKIDHSSTPLMTPLSSIDTSVPALYKEVLRCLREIDASGRWPTTTAKRQMVMVSTPTDENGARIDTQGTIFSSLSVAHSIAKNNKYERSSPYVFKEGEGGASGSFSVGAMPGTSGQPKANSLFPELMKNAFELERRLLPDRKPSSTIAVNRNAQFRPHTDSGAGVGQGTSLIVALGNFVGGELMVEGEQADIRYSALEFNGWKQRHWTMPFRGERYSLVWFTPLGCEGVRGIDLCP